MVAHKRNQNTETLILENKKLKDKHNEYYFVEYTRLPMIIKVRTLLISHMESVTEIKA